MGKLSSVLAAITPTAPATEKVAAVKAATTTDTAVDQLRTALSEALASPSEKTASATPSTPVQDLEKVAAQVLEQDNARLQKEAHAYGIAVADGFMAQMAAYNAASEKVATVAATDVSVDFEKFASAHPEIIKEAHDFGYTQTVTQLATLKQAAYERGVNAGIEAIYNTGTETFARGFQDMGNILNG